MKLKSYVKGLSCAMLLCGLSMIGSEALAAHGTYNPMMPRQLSQEDAQKEFSYGYTILSGHALDTLEEPNRMMWYLNYDILDQYILRPVSHAYVMLPSPIRTGVGNFLNNLDEINNAPNNLLAGDPEGSVVSVFRFGINTTFGLLGLFDAASAMGMEARPMSMSTVLGKAGVDQGHYIMVPGYGPSTMRNLHGAAIDSVPFMSLSWPLSLAKMGLEGIHTRAGLIDQEAVIDNAIDPYVQTRDVYLMYDENKVNPVQEGEVTVDDGFDEDILEDIDEL